MAMQRMSRERGVGRAGWVMVELEGRGGSAGGEARRRGEASPMPSGRVGWHMLGDRAGHECMPGSGTCRKREGSFVES